MSENKHTNRLIDESSPYLLQHAHNPVEWYAWNDEAFEKARKEDKPIFLSIGYSTCHWCHVMERESFEDEEVAEILNKDYIAIKVDREERPDIDQVYMEVCQMMTGSGGWPLTILMTPDKKPFFAGTYFPKKAQYGRIGVMEMLTKVTEIWNSDRLRITNTVNEIIKNLNAVNELTSENDLNLNVNSMAFSNFVNAYEENFGGFSVKPKFPSPHNLVFQLRYHHRTQNKQALKMATHTLKMMALGGMYDHVGFGFHRYSTDEKWLVPHFEKMLYDQATLISAYSEAFQITGNPFFKKVVGETIEYLLRDMTSEDGGFFSAEDADSEGVEGKFYIWEKDEINDLLRDDADLFNDIYNISDLGNFIEENHTTLNGKNIPHLKQTISDLAKEKGLREEELTQKLDSLRKILFEKREQRIHPFKDDKILTDWNALMISSLAKAYRAFGENTYLEAAIRAYDFIDSNLKKENELLHRFRHGNAGIKANLDDYAFLTEAALELYNATFDIKYLEDSITIAKQMIRKFADEEKGGFYFTPNDGEELFHRKKDLYDGAIPSGNSVAFDLMNKLTKMTGDQLFTNTANLQLDYFKAYIEQAPNHYAHFLSGLEFYFGETSEIIVVGEAENEDTKAILDQLKSKYLPNTVILFKDKDDERLSDLAEYTRDHKMLDQKPTIYLCKNFSCDQPTNDLAQVLEKLN